MTNQIACYLSWNDIKKTLQALAMGLIVLPLTLTASADDKSKLLIEVHFDPGSA